MQEGCIDDVDDAVGACYIWSEYGDSLAFPVDYESVVVGLLDEEVKLSADGGQVDVVPFAEVVLLSSGTQLLDPFHGVRLVGYDQMALQNARRVIVVLRHEELLDGGGMVHARLLPGPVPRYKIRELLRGVAQLFVEAALLAQLVGVV